MPRPARVWSDSGNDVTTLELPYKALKIGLIRPGKDRSRGRSGFLAVLLQSNNVGQYTDYGTVAALLRLALGGSGHL